MKTARSEIEKIIERHQKLLDPKAKSRWHQGYVDGLRDALKIMRRYGDDKGY